MTIIALSGKAHVGKDSFADVLVKKHGFTRIALADPLRELCSRVFHMPYDDFSAHDKKDERIQRIHLDFHHIDKIREIVEFEWGYTIEYERREEMEEGHGTDLDSPRDILRCVGMMLRNAVSPTIWVELALVKIREIGPKIVITDCRFGNERDIFSKMGAVLCLIKRNDNGDPNEHEFNLGKDGDYDVVFDNSETLSKFQSDVDMWYTIRREELQYYQVFKYE